MPYNTRRKSLSLPSLGIQLPSTSRVHRSPPVAKESASNENSPPSKRIKRSHDEIESPAYSPIQPSPNSSPSRSSDPRRPKSRRSTYEHTPPPSPKSEDAAVQIDTEGINDDIVVAVIEQLQKTGNRPHLIRELATVLAATNESIAHSANPAALLSSRLSVYLKRPWTALSPCPLAKELIPVHPRKIFFFLTTCPRQEVPTTSDDIITPIAASKQLTPSISASSIDQDDLDVDARARMRMSPSPEIDLSNPELDDDLDGDIPAPPTPAGSYSARSSLTREGAAAIDTSRLRRNRAPSPPLEADEKGFTDMANEVKARTLSLHDEVVHPTTEIPEPVGDGVTESTAETAEQTRRRDQELGLALFGSGNSLATTGVAALVSSPIIHATKMNFPVESKKEHQLAIPAAVTPLMTSVGVNFQDIEMANGWDVRSPEDVELGELDGLFSDF